MIRLLRDSDVDTLCEHRRRIAEEATLPGELVTAPRSPHEPFDTASTRDRYRVGWSQRVDQPLWIRSWALLVDGVFRGHLDLHGGRMPSELHRATLGIGIERAARGRGNGAALLETAIAWSREQGLAWMDLAVFAHNTPARALYKKLGFVEVGMTRDRFRVDGQEIDDIAMTRAL